MIQVFFRVFNRSISPDFYFPAEKFPQKKFVTQNFYFSADDFFTQKNFRKEKQKKLPRTIFVQPGNIKNAEIFYAVVERGFKTLF